MLIAAILSAFLAATPESAIQDSLPPPVPSTLAMDAVDLGELTVTGRSLETATRAFVREVAAPSRNRGLARWRGAICVDVLNLQAPAARFIVERVSETARTVGLTPGGAGCTPNVIIVATDDAAAFTPQFVAMRPRLFRVGGAGMDQGAAALRRFQVTDRPVRWWTVTMPVDEMGRNAVRIPGYCSGSCLLPSDMAPGVKTLGSRLSSSTEDDIERVFIIVDVDQVAALSAYQLADYLAMVTLAQVDADADTGGFATILNVFDDPEGVAGLTQWDEAYLKGLYQAQRMSVNQQASASEIAGSIVRARRAMDGTTGN